MSLLGSYTSLLGAYISLFRDMHTSLLGIIARTWGPTIWCSALDCSWQSMYVSFGHIHVSSGYKPEVKQFHISLLIVRDLLGCLAGMYTSLLGVLISLLRDMHTSLLGIIVRDLLVWLAVYVSFGRMKKKNHCSWLAGMTCCICLFWAYACLFWVHKCLFWVYTYPFCETRIRLFWVSLFVDLLEFLLVCMSLLGVYMSLLGVYMSLLGDITRTWGQTIWCSSLDCSWLAGMHFRNWRFFFLDPQEPPPEAFRWQTISMSETLWEIWSPPEKPEF